MAEAVRSPSPDSPHRILTKGLSKPDKDTGEECTCGVTSV